MPWDAVTGAFGYTGRYVASRLLASGRNVRTLTGHPARPSPFGDGVPVLPLRWDEPRALARSLEGADTLYNTYWIRFARNRLSHAVAVERSRSLFQAAARAGVRRVVHISITGARVDSPLPYFRGKALVERALQASGLSWAIVRPALIFGPQDILLHNIAWILRRLPVFIVFGDGRYPIQPVHVEDLADLAVDLGRRDERVAVDAVGPETYAYEDLVWAIAAALGRRPRIAHTPPAAAWALGAALSLVVGDVVVTRDEIAGLMAGLLVSGEAPTGSRRLSAWLQANAGELGRHWVSELERHYR